MNIDALLHVQYWPRRRYPPTTEKQNCPDSLNFSQWSGLLPEYTNNAASIFIESVRLQVKIKSIRRNTNYRTL